MKKTLLFFAALGQPTEMPVYPSTLRERSLLWILI